MASRAIRTNQMASTMLKVAPSRSMSVKTQFKSINKKINKIGEEDSKESKTALSLVRKAGALSVVLVLVSLFWNSSMGAPAPSEEPLVDITKDVRQ